MKNETRELTELILNAITSFAAVIVALLAVYGFFFSDFTDVLVAQLRTDIVELKNQKIDLERDNSEIKSSLTDEVKQRNTISSEIKLLSEQKIEIESQIKELKISFDKYSYQVTASTVNEFTDKIIKDLNDIHSSVEIASSYFSHIEYLKLTEVRIKEAEAIEHDDKIIEEETAKLERLLEINMNSMAELDNDRDNSVEHIKKIDRIYNEGQTIRGQIISNINKKQDNINKRLQILMDDKKPKSYLSLNSNLNTEFRTLSLRNSQGDIPLSEKLKKNYTETQSIIADIKETITTSDKNINISTKDVLIDRKSLNLFNELIPAHRESILNLINEYIGNNFEVLSKPLKVNLRNGWTEADLEESVTAIRGNHNHVISVVYTLGEVLKQKHR